MANHKSAIKRARQNIKRRERNDRIETQMRTVVKDSLETINSTKSVDDARKALTAAESALNKAARRGVIPQNRAGRKTSRLTALLNKKFKTKGASKQRASVR